MSVAVAVIHWEYLVLEVGEPFHSPGITLLNDYGRKGWEAYAVTRTTGPAIFHQVHMKRPLAAQLESAAEEKPK